jgi:hypothetical protein
MIEFIILVIAGLFALGSAWAYEGDRQDRKTYDKHTVEYRDGDNT